MIVEEPQTLETRETQRDHIAEFFDELGVEVERLNPVILRKLRLLNRETKTFQDGERAIQLAKDLFAYYEENIPDQTFTDQEQKTVLIGTIFTDIGKTGPRNATPEQEMIILDIYNTENINVNGRRAPAQITLVDFMNTYFPEDAEERLLAIEAINKVDRNMTMRAFYNLHPEWTLQIISGDGVPLEAVAAAAVHHALEGVNPENIVGKDGRFTKYFGENTSFSRDDKLIIILDKYYAFRRRSQMTHIQAIEAVLNKIKSSEQFADDLEFKELLNDFDKMILSKEKREEITENVLQ